MKKSILGTLFFVLVAIAVLYYTGWIGDRNMNEDIRGVENTASKEDTLVAFNGIHWHPELRIFVNDEQVAIPANVGLAGEHSPIHTHTDLPVIHLEFASEVRESDIVLGKFFEVWDRDFYEFGDNVRMVVNGRENTEYENYVMQHEDDIVLYYTTK